MLQYLLGMIATLVGMFFLHKGQRDVEREKRLQYWREQNAFRQNIMQMQETARHSIMSLPTGGSQRTSFQSRDETLSVDSQMPMLRDKNRGSGLRNFVSGDNLSADVSEESIMMKRPDNRF